MHVVKFLRLFGLSHHAIKRTRAQGNSGCSESSSMKLHFSADFVSILEQLSTAGWAVTWVYRGEKTVEFSAKNALTKAAGYAVCTEGNLADRLRSLLHNGSCEFAGAPTA